MFPTLTPLMAFDFILNIASQETSDDWDPSWCMLRFDHYLHGEAEAWRRMCSLSLFRMRGSEIKTWTTHYDSRASYSNVSRSTMHLVTRALEHQVTTKLIHRGVVTFNNSFYKTCSQPFTRVRDSVSYMGKSKFERKSRLQKSIPRPETKCELQSPRSAPPANTAQRLPVVQRHQEIP